MEGRRSAATLRRVRSRWCAPASCPRARAAGSRSRRFSRPIKQGGAMNRIMGLLAGLALALLASVLLALAATNPASAQPKPAQPNPFAHKPTIEITVLFPAGSSADITARLLADGISKELGTNVIVVNRPGAGGAIGYRHVAGQKPDGTSLVWNSNSISTAFHSGTLAFDYKSFVEIG